MSFRSLLRSLERAEYASDLVEIFNNSNASSPQADLASFARVTKRISSIATAVLYRSIRLTDGRSAQLLVRTYLDGINPFTLAQGLKFPRVKIESVCTLRVSQPFQLTRLMTKQLDFDFPQPQFKTVKVSERRAYPFDARNWQYDRRVYQKGDTLPSLDVLANYGYLSHLTTLRLSNFLDPTNLVPLLLGPGKPLRQQLKAIDIVHSEDNRGSVRDDFASTFILAAPAFVAHPGYFLDLPILSSNDIFGEKGNHFHLDIPFFLTSDSNSCEPASDLICHQACYDFETFGSIWNWPFFLEDRELRLSEEKLLHPPSGTRFDSLQGLRIRIESDSYLPIVFNKRILPHLRRLALLTTDYWLTSVEEVAILRRSISR